MKQSLLCYFLISVLFLILSVFCEKNVINLKQGQIQGSYSYLGDYWSYLGVPYAEFKGRFQEPGDPSCWNGIFKANRGSITCKQYSPSTKSVTGEEDCLTLSVYTPISPSNTSKKQLPVIFFVHGGGFYSGSNTDNTYNARYLVQKGVVVVTVNYRLGAFGFLCLKINGAAGNMGLKDQLAALIWTKNNIASFGGDPESVTLFGESVGAASVDYFVLTQTAKRLFQRAIMDSGTSLTTQAFDSCPIATAAKAARRLGYSTTDTDELLKIFLNASADDVARVSSKDNTNDALASYIFKPCIEDPNTSHTTILTKDPRELVQSVGDISNISIIIGYNNKEGIFWAQNYDYSGLRNLDRNFSSAIPDIFTCKKPEYRADLSNDIKESYFNNCSTNYDRLIDYFSDFMVMGPSVATMEAYLSNPNISMFNYYFTYDSFRNLVKLRSNLRMKRGASHVDELFYMFDPKVLRYIPQTPSDIVMIDRMTSFWASFAKTGIPSTSTDILWPRSVNSLQFLKLDKNLEVIDLPNRDRINFWKRSFERYAQI